MFMFWGSLAGAMMVMVAVLFAANRVKSIVTLLVIGMMAGYLCSAINSFLTAFAEQERIASFTLWSMGGFSGFTWAQVRVLLTITTVFSIAALMMSKPLNALLMGESYAESMGVGIRRVRVGIVFITSVLTAVLTAYAGPISFVGLAVPHLIRMSFRTSDNRILLPASILGGGLMTSLCDLLARTLFSPRELPIGAITAVIGTPMVIYMLLKRDNQL
jgi:iron complex transport system permease protein